MKSKLDYIRTAHKSASFDQANLKRHKENLEVLIIYYH